MASPRVTRSRARATSSQEPGAGAAAAVAAVALPPAWSAAAVAASEAGPSRRKRPLEPQLSPLSEDDYSCPICLNLLLDPVVSACGHDCCQLCFQRWTVGQGKRSCPVCRAALAGGPAAPLPGVCLRLQRTLEQLFPERIKERQEEVAEQRRQLAEERRRQEAARRQAAERAAATSSHDRLVQAILEHVLHEHMDALVQMSAGGRGPGAARAQPAQQAAPQQVQQAQQQLAGGRRPGSAGAQAVQAGAAAAAAAAAPQAPQQQPQQPPAQAGSVARMLSSGIRALQSRFGGAGGDAPRLAPGQQAPAQQQSAAGQPDPGETVATTGIELQFEIHLRTQPQQQGPPQGQVTQLGIPLSALLGRTAAPAAPAAAAAGGRGASNGNGSGAGAGGGASAAWPEGPPLEDMQFEMGWGEQNRRRRSNRGSRNSGGGSGRR